MLQNSCCASGLCSSASKPAVHLPAYQPQTFRDASVPTVYSSAPPFQSEQDQAYQLGYNDALVTMGNMSRALNADSKSHKPSGTHSSKHHQKRRQDRHRRHAGWSRPSSMMSSHDDSDSSRHYSTSEDSTEDDKSESSIRRHFARAAARHSSNIPNIVRSAQLYARPPCAYPLNHPMNIPALPFTNFSPHNFNAHPPPSSIYPSPQYMAAPQIHDSYLSAPCTDCQDKASQRPAQAGRHWNPYGVGEPVTWCVGTDGKVIPVAGDPRQQKTGYGYGLGFGCRGDGF